VIFSVWLHLSLICNDENSRRYDCDGNNESKVNPFAHCSPCTPMVIV
jgi:hypothetical protein